MISAVTASREAPQANVAARTPEGAGVGNDLRSRLLLARLPSIPQVLVRLLELCQKDSATLADIADLLACDAALTARVMSVASSASQHGRQKVSSLEHCLSRLGLNMVKTIVINESIFQVFRCLGNERDYDLSQFWAHSLRCAMIACGVARKTGDTDPDEAYLGGLLHDVGQLAMLSADPAAYIPLFLAQEGSDELCQREHALFGLTHAEVGAWLIEKWDLHSLLSDCVLYHHDQPERLAGAYPLIRYVHLADRLAALEGAEPGETEELLARCLVDTALDLRALVRESEQEVREMAAQFGITLSKKGASSATTEEKTVEPGRAALVSRVYDVLTLDTLPKVPVAKSTDELLHYLSQAALLVFDVQPVLAFLAQDDGPSDLYSAVSLHPLMARASRLSFLAGQGASAIAGSLERGPCFVDCAKTRHDLLDDQLSRLIGKSALLYLPMRDDNRCSGVLVAGVENSQQVENLVGRLQCLEQFGAMAGRLLSPSKAATDSESLAKAMPEHPDLVAHRNHFRKVIHEVGTPLTVIQNYLAVLERKFADKDIGTRELGIMAREIGRVGRILRQATDEPKVVEANAPVQLNAVISEVVALCCPAQQRSPLIDIQTDLFPGLPDMNIDGDRLRQLLINLIGNAADALSTVGGVVRISTNPWSDGASSTYTEIRIEDSGPGLPREVQDRLYQPVATDKGMHHLGLGLAIVGQLVRELGALINCRSSERGTCFQILLPLAQ